MNSTYQARFTYNYMKTLLADQAPGATVENLDPDALDTLADACEEFLAWHSGECRGVSPEDAARLFHEGRNGISEGCPITDAASDFGFCELLIDDNGDGILLF